MTVILLTTKTKGLQIKGEIHKVENIREIVEEEKRLRLIRHENWETFVSKELFKIIAIEYAE